MTPGRSTTRSPYMEWSKINSNARFNLATSGMMALPLAELGVTIEQLEINGSNNYGYAPLLDAIARRYHTPRECVVAAMGTSLANYLALAAATDAGDEILVEQPSYDPLLSAADYLGLKLKRFQRPADQGFAVDLEDLERNLTDHTRLIALCNLHNPSGALLPDSVLQKIARLARKHGAYVLVDEVYREMLFETSSQTSFHLDPERFIVTNSLTKAYGLSGLRCGWILAPPELAVRMWHIHDVHGSTYSHPAELLSVIALEELPEISSKMKSLLDINRELLRNFLSGRDDLDYFWPEYGTIVFPRHKHGSVDDLCSLLRADFDTTVVPGRFFESPDRFRLGVGMSTGAVRESLAQLGRGLDAYQRKLSKTS